MNSRGYYVTELHLMIFKCLILIWMLVWSAQRSDFTNGCRNTYYTPTKEGKKKCNSIHRKPFYCKYNGHLVLHHWLKSVVKMWRFHFHLLVFLSLLLFFHCILSLSQFVHNLIIFHSVAILSHHRISNSMGKKAQTNANTFKSHCMDKRSYFWCGLSFIGLVHNLYTANPA